MDKGDKCERRGGGGVAEAESGGMGLDVVSVSEELVSGELYSGEEG